MSSYTALRKVIIAHRSKLVLTYILFSLEMLGSLLRPFFLGMAVNDLLKGSYRGLVILSLVHLLWLLAGTLRQRYDTRTYSAIYTSMVTRVLCRPSAQSDISRLSAHSNLAREFVDFLEFDLVYVLEALYNMLGSLLLLLWYDASVLFICLGLLAPVIISSYFYGRRMKKLNRLKNDELEKQVDVIASGNPARIRRHYFQLQQWQIRISDQEAWNFGLLEFFVMAAIAAALLISHQHGEAAPQAGDLIGLYSYILKFVSGIDTIPYTVQRLASLQDISERMDLQAEEESGPSLPEIPLPSIGLPGDTRASA